MEFGYSAIRVLPPVVVNNEVNVESIMKYGHLFEANYSFTAPNARHMRAEILKKFFKGLTKTQLPLAVMYLTNYMMVAQSGGKGHCFNLLRTALEAYQTGKL